MSVLAPGPLQRWCLAGLAGAAAIVGCTYDFDAPFAQTPSSTATGGSGTSSGGGGGAAPGGGGTSSTSSSGTGGGEGGSGGGTCVPDPVELDVTVLNVVVLVDLSLSMNQGTLWPDTVTALSQFFGDAQSVALNVALNYFPPPGETNECLVSHHNPPQVPLTDLATHANVLVADLNAQSPFDGTPPAPALEGSLDFAGAHEGQNPNHEVIVVMVTDGQPTACETNVSAIATIVAAGLSSHGVRTYTIGIGGVQLWYLDQLASAGDTGQAYDNTSSTLQVAASMADIHERAFPCSYTMLDPPQGSLQPDQVNVSYTPGGVGSPQSIPQAANEADCGGAAGWYYDDDQAPTEIHFCATTCAALRQDVAPKVEILFGCPSVPN